MSVRIQFFGGVKTVTGSMHLISNGTAALLVDCGLFQGHREEFFTRNASFPFDTASIDACVLSHAHIDHSGNIPNLVKQGFRGNIVTTSATQDLCSAMLPDSGHIQEDDIKFVNKIHKRKGLPIRRPLYTRTDAEACLEFFRGHPYHNSVELAKGAAVTFYDAGHVLGSATPLIEIDDGGAARRIGYAVDLGRANMPILNDPERPPAIEFLLLESTYGGRLHDSAEEARGKLAAIVNKTVQRGGKIIVPSFALERTQEVVYHLHRLLGEKRIPDIPIYVDSPLAVNITEVFLRHPECYDEEMHRAFRSGADPLGTNRIHYITDVDESKKLNDRKGPMIIISASGMCEAGRILHHLKNNIEDPRNTVLVVGYMAKNTLGRRIVERHPTVKIFGMDHDLRAEVSIINAFSAHADRNELVEYITPLKGTIKGIFIVHGEEDQSESLYDLLKDEGFPVHMPSPGDVVELA